MRRLAATLLLAAAAAAGPKVSLPVDGVLVHHVDFDAIRRTEAWARVAGPVREGLGDAMGLEGFFEQTGFDPAKDLDALTLVLGGDIATEPRTYGIARGHIDAEKFVKCMETSGLTATSRDGVTVYEDPGSKGKLYCAFHGALALVGDSVLFADPAEGMDALLAARKAGAGESGLAKALEAAPDAHAWTVFLPTPALRKAFRDEAKEDPQAAPFAALISVSVQYHLGDPIEIRCAAEAESADLAKQVATVVQGGLAGFGLEDAAKLDCEGARIEGSLSLPLEDAMTLMGMPVESPERPGTSAQPVVTEGAPILEGEGRLQRLALRGQINKLVSSPDGRYVFVERALESSVVLDSGLRVVGKSDAPGEGMAFTLDGNAGLWPRIAGGNAEIRTTPGLAKTCTVAAPQGSFDDYWAICALPDGKNFVVAGWSEVRIFHMDPPSWGDAGRSALDRPVAGAVDAKTGLLVLVAGDRLDLFDPGNLRSVGTRTLPHPATFDVAATAGRAWVGTKAGTIVPVDLDARRVLDPVAVGEGDVSLARCGDVLVAAAERFVDADHHPTRIVAFRIEGTSLREIAAATFPGPCAWNDLTVVPERHAAILGGRESFVWTYRSD